jgi:hypothetical protein
VNVFHGNIWELHSLMKEPRYDIAIGTNVGWTSRGLNVMGRGLALEAKNRYNHLPNKYGLWCIVKGDEPMYDEKSRIWCVPSKPLNGAAPHTSWMGKGSYSLVEKGLKHLKKHVPIYKTRVAVPLLGAGNAGLDPQKIQRMIETILGEDDRFTLVLYEVK